MVGREGECGCLGMDREREGGMEGGVLNCCVMGYTRHK